MPFPEVGGGQMFWVEEEERSCCLVALRGCCVGGVEESTRGEEDFYEGSFGKAEAGTVDKDGERGIWGERDGRREDLDLENLRSVCV